MPAIWLVAGIGLPASASAIVLGMTPPSQLGHFSTPAFIGIILAGVLVLAIPPQLIYRWRRPSWAEIAPSTADEELADTDAP